MAALDHMGKKKIQKQLIQRKKNNNKQYAFVKAR